jgi:hypothetical protein
MQYPRGFHLIGVFAGMDKAHSHLANVMERSLVFPEAGDLQKKISGREMLFFPNGLPM